MKLGDKIKQLRNDAELTQPELAEKAQIEQSYLSKLENEKGTPSFAVIEKIANAFDLTGMALIESLDISYVQEQLTHIPEIAVQAAEKSRLEEEKIKKWYLQGVLLIVFGIALYFIGTRGIFISKNLYEYSSAGFIEVGEPLERYKTSLIGIINENDEELDLRIKENRKRLNEVQLKESFYRGDSFVESYGEKRRYFELTKEKFYSSIYPKSNDVIALLGIMSFISGWFLMFFIYRFTRK
ncbi:MULTISPECIES: helix-turn-helix domain-containing protein [unclassified Colwellia]|uniref:helix-turn-helix domain-containing protein n=1 Tax=unclassified Colwellia TaxID=196834 RepID=UPI0015F35636|nr:MULTISPECIES: helix-turn-helix domain-containing protein [unclassified Colwellia]MBA6234454.1 helix-turn-helix domain-containing protein [Colwellia sp. MB02u-7]MBA6236875.1 helix-turn-helix domain-containing protein [Colwellia sp. MB02u-11]MBA6256182.1 helix-turn-helix domain-containing protein [Colwellia sp. MB3u-28]MBA6260066.1 helix-turn-helix domain-containing protein [Colwellia sp. MB3u-41]MBA6299985.1 helix-turn-helix domain-containing protein [Colwellia sp. MB3u-22]